MTKSSAARGPRAAWWEILGAWLRVWTPPRDIEIPSPRRTIVIALAVVAPVVVVSVTLIAPAIDSSKERDAEQANQARQATRAQIRARLVAEQQPRFARAPRLARLYRAGRREAALTALTVAAHASVDRDVRERVASGALAGPLLSVQCAARPAERGARVHLDCLAVTADHVHKRIHEVRIGHPFVVGASLRDGRYAWCKDNRRPAEGSFGNTVEVALSHECAR